MAKPLKTIEPLIELSQKSLLATSHILAAVIVALIICLLTWDEPASDVISNIIFATGGIGALYGLIIASKRQDRFEEQVRQNHVILKAQQRQNFNEQLSRGIVLLADQENTSIRLASIRVLQKLGKTRNKNRKKLVLNILHDHITEKEGLKLSNSEIENTVNAILAIKSEQPITFNYLDLSNLNLRYLTLENVTFDRCNLARASFGRIIFNNCNFRSCYLVRSSFNKVSFNNCGIYGCDLSFDNFSNCNFDAYTHSTFGDLTHTIFQDNKNLYPVFFNGYCYEKKRPPKFYSDDLNIDFEIDTMQSYEWLKNKDGQKVRMRETNDPNNPNKIVLKELGWHLPQPSNQS